MERLAELAIYYPAMKSRLKIVVTHNLELNIDSGSVVGMLMTIRFQSGSAFSDSTFRLIKVANPPFC